MHPSRPVRTRFAPSPTGLLHVGNAMAALFNWLFARHYKGEFFLRIDDTDTQRSKEHYVQAIETDLSWLGLDWDGQFRQSQRTVAYAQAIDFLKQQGRLYPCYESAEYLDEQRQKQLALGLPPIYKRTKPEPKTEHPAHWRFELDRIPIAWSDLLQGEKTVDASHLSDPIVIRADGAISYLLSSVIDDMDYGMTHLIRGSDHVTNTVVQIQLFHALAPSKQGGVLFPQWAHFPLLGNMDGEKISKRNGGLTLQALRAQGILPLTLCHELASLGLSHRIDGSLQDMAKTFRLDEYGRNSPKLDFSQLLSHNQSLIQSLSYEDMLKSVYAMTSKPHGASCSHELWEVVRPNLSCLSELSHWIEVCLGSFSPLDPFLPPLEGVSIPKLLALCPKDPWDETTWDQWIQCILQTYPTLKKGTVNGWLRKKLTGKERGPKMGVLFPLLLPKKVHERLSL